MGIRVLGPLVADEIDGQLRRRERVVVAALCTSPGRAMTADALVDALWPLDPPPSAHKVLQGCIHRLRKQLGSEAIETTPYGYRLAAQPDEVDAHVFARHVTRARELLAVGESDRAGYLAELSLELWRGPALPDLEGWEPGAVEAGRLDQLRLEAEELRVDALLRSGRHEQVQADAAALAHAAPLREKRWGLLALAQYRCGRQAEALATIDEAATLLSRELGIDPSPALEDLRTAILRQDASVTYTDVPTTGEGGCPYRGLEAYDVEDAELFSGRADELTTCLAGLRHHGVLAVVGPSGLGKSSLVRAGVAATLERSGTPVTVLQPGARPLDVLDSLPRTARSHAWVVDQAEELFTMCADGSSRTRFVEALAAHVVRAPLVLALRTDRLADVAAHPALARLVERGLYLLGPMSEESLREAITEPARQQGVLLEPGLVDVLLHEVEVSPGALPLLSHALRETWRRREGHTMTVAGYQAAGGVRGAVAQTAEALYAGVSDEDRAQLKSILLRLVAPGPQGEPDRARVPRRLVVTTPGHEQLLEALIDARLVTSDEGEVQLAHESLGRSWPRLTGWLDDDVEGRRILRHLTLAADAWDAAGRLDTDLYGGTRLRRAAAWHEKSDVELSPLETDFLQRSLAVARSGAARTLASRSLSVDDPELSLLLAVQSVRTDDNAQTREALRAGLARRPELIATSEPLSDELVHLTSNRDGTRLAATTTDETVWLFDAETLRVLASWSPPSGGHRPVFGTRALQFAPDGQRLLVGSQMYRQPPLMYLDSTTLAPVGFDLAGLLDRPAKVVELHHSADGRFLAASLVYASGTSRPGPETFESAEVRVWDLEHRDRAPRVLPGPLPTPFWDWLKLSGDGRVVYLSNPMRKVVVATGREVWRRDDITTSRSFALSRDERWLAVPHPDRLYLLDAGTGEVRRTHVEDANSAHISPDDYLLVSATYEGGKVRALESGDLELEISSPPGWPVFSRDSSVLHLSAERSIQEWDLRGERRFVRRRDLGVRQFMYLVSPVFSPSGAHLATYSDTGDLDAHQVTLFDTVEARAVVATEVGRSDETVPMSWRRDGRELAVGDLRGEITLIQLPDTVRTLALRRGGIAHLDYAPDGAHLLVVTLDCRLDVVDARTGRISGRSISLPGTAARWVSASPSAHEALVLLASGSAVTGAHPAAWDLARCDLSSRTVICSRTLTLSETGPLASVTYSPEGDRAVLVGEHGPMLIDPATLATLSRPGPGTPHDTEIGGFSPDGTLIATGTDRERVRLWDGHTGQLLDTLAVDSSGNTFPYVDREKTIVQVATGLGELFEVTTDIRAAMEAAHRIAGRSLTREEWEAHVGDLPHRET